MTDIPWSKAARLQFIHYRLGDDGGIGATPVTVQDLSLRMAVEEACVQRQGEGFAETSIGLVDGTRAWRGQEIADLERQLEAARR